jgi:hypothetical protein
MTTRDGHSIAEHRVPLGRWPRHPEVEEVQPACGEDRDADLNPCSGASRDPAGDTHQTVATVARECARLGRIGGQGNQTHLPTTYDASLPQVFPVFGCL